MEKYYIAHTEEEVKMGDTLELDLTEDLPNGKVRHHYVQCRMLPELLPLLLEAKVIDCYEDTECSPERV